jgi:predicted O-methyltransferase YrrM
MNGFTWRNVPGYFDFSDIYKDMVAKAPLTGAHFVEIGVLFGCSTTFMGEEIRKSGKTIRFDAIDKSERPKMALIGLFDSATEQFMSPSYRRPDLRQAVAEAPNQEAAVRATLAMAGLSEVVNFIVARGQDAAARYADGSLDFVFIDTEHIYDDTVSLLRLYLPKLKPTGVIAGHDFTREYPEVERAVRDVLGEAAAPRGRSFFCEVKSLRK